MNDFVDNSDEGYDILYADDDTSSVADKNVDTLQTKLQNKADAATQWIQDNAMLCSGEKTKLLVVSTKELRAARLVNKEVTVNVCGQTIMESIVMRNYWG